MKEIDTAEAQAMLAEGNILGDNVPISHNSDTHAMLAVEVTGAYLSRDRIKDVPLLPDDAYIGVTIILTVGRDPSDLESVGITASVTDPDILTMSAAGLTSMMTSLAENTTAHLVKQIVGDPGDLDDD